MIRFTDHADRDLVPKSEVEAFFNTKVSHWMKVNSQGLYTIKPTVIDWITTDNTEAYYSFGKRGIVPEAQQMAWPALDELDNRADWDWTQFDLDDNGQIDSLVYMHSGYGAETTTTDCFGADYNNRIWAHGELATLCRGAIYKLDSFLMLSFRHSQHRKQEKSLEIQKWKAHFKWLHHRICP
jgi:M6 family metalloprotease-like protein